MVGRSAVQYVLVFCAITIGLFYLTLQLRSPWFLVDPFDETGDVDILELSYDDGRLHPERHVDRLPRTNRHFWNVTIGTRRPDGVARPVFLINGAFPGPTIESRSGDELEVEVYNGMQDEEPIAIHWHGLYMKGYNDMDGVPGLTQSAIPPGESFTYRFRVDHHQYGTFWYHGHTAGHYADGLYGGLVIHKPLEVGEAVTDAVTRPEYLLLIGDWYHRRAKEMLAWYMDKGHFANEPGPDSMLINGQGQFDCSLATKARPVDCVSVAPPQLEFKGDNVKLRVVNTGALTGFTLGISDANMTVTHVDGGHEVDYARSANSVGVLYPGERVDVLVESSSSSSHLTVSLDKELLRLRNYALRPDQSFPLVWDRRSHGPDTHATSVELIDRFDLGAATGPTVHLPSEVVDHAVLYANIEIRAAMGEIPLGVINHTSWRVTEPYSQPLLRLNRAEWPTNDAPVPGKIQLHIPHFELDLNGWLEMTINNVDDRGHPFHLHGHSFYVVAVHGSMTTLEPSFNPFASAQPPGTTRNLVNPIRKDTVHIPRKGYAVLRFKLDNEGLWLLHCHALWHNLMGMGIPLEIGQAAGP